MSSVPPPAAGFDPPEGRGHVTRLLQGHYRLDEEIARGGSGIVYRAWDETLEREVAIKILRDSALPNEHARARFRLEAAAAAGLAHPGIVRVYEIGEDRDLLFLAMEYVEGQNLEQLTKNGPLPAKKAARLVKEAAEAVQCAHDAGVLHRDLKPSNVLVGPDGRARLTDFGLARRDGGDGLTLTGDVMGTPGYMAPEQASGASHGTAVDIYSLGALLYHLLTGRAPHTGENHTVVLGHMMESDPLPPRLLNPETPIDLQTVSLKALERDPARRYANAREIADELDRFLHGEPIRARPVSAPERAWRWCRRKPVLAAALGSLALALTGFIATLLVSIGKINALSKEAVERLYASDMRLALQNISDGKLNAAMTLLERHRPADGKARDLRNFEWYHALERCQSQETAALAGLTGRADSLAFSPDGKIIAAGADQLCLWRLPEKTPFFTQKWPARVTSLAFSPEGSRLAVACADGALKLLDMTPANAGTELAATDCHEQKPALAWNASGESLTVLAGTRRWQWNPLQQQSLADKGAFPLTPWPPALRSDAATAAYTTTPRWEFSLIDLNGGHPLAQWIETASIARSAALSPDGTQIAIGYFSGLLSVYDLEPASGRTDFRSKREQIAASSMINVLAYSRNAKKLASAASGAVQVWNPGNLASLKAFNGHHHAVRSLAFSPDNTILASGDDRGHVKLWDLNNTNEDTRLAVHFSSDGKTRARHLQNGSLEIERSNGRRQIVTPASDSSLALGEVKALWNGGAVFGWANPVMLDFDTGRRDASLPPKAQVDNCSPDGRWIYFTLPPDNAPCLWDREQKRIVFRPEPDPPNPARMSFSADSRFACMGYRSGLARIYDLNTLEVVQTFKAHDNWAYARAFSKNGKHLATSGMDGKTKLWDWREGKLLREFASSADTYWSVALSPDGSRVAAGTAESSVVLWDVTTGLECGVIELEMPPKTVEQLCFTTDGSSLITEQILLRTKRGETR